MDAGLKERIVDRLISNITYLRIDGSLYRLLAPTKDHRALAELFYNEIIGDVKYSDLISRDQAKFMLEKTGTWGIQQQKQLEDYQEAIENLKVQMYKSLYDTKQQKALLRKLKSYEKSVERAWNKKYSLESMTWEYHAESLRREFLTALCIQTIDGTPVYTYDNFWGSDATILRRFLNFLDNNSISQKEYRELARSEPFRSSWVLGKEKVFGIPVCDLSDSQKNLVLYSRMYDSAYENPERPSEEVIDDDYMFDGWMAHSRKEAEKERSKQEVDKLLGSKRGASNSNADNVFVVAGSPEEADKIKGLNDINARVKMSQRDTAVKEKGKLDEQNLPDVKLDLRNQAMKQMAAR